MTYFGFLLSFVSPPILILLVITFWDIKNGRSISGFQDGRSVWTAIGIHVLLAVLYTTPWDNYLVATGVWHYNPGLVTGLVIGYVPIEEYTFFVVETILAGLWWWFLARRLHAPLLSEERLGSSKALVYGSVSILIFLWLIFSYIFFFGDTSWTYLSIILFWALPAILLQFVFGADILWHFRKLIFWAILIPGTYLSLIDIVALRATTWSISPTQTTGIVFFGILPLEEVVFFFITNTMIAFGMTLLLANASRVRYSAFKELGANLYRERVDS
jgi:lycopene cyclase domain-containing protein